MKMFLPIVESKTQRSYEEQINKFKKQLDAYKNEAALFPHAELHAFAKTLESIASDELKLILLSTLLTEVFRPLGLMHPKSCAFEKPIQIIIDDLARARTKCMDSNFCS